MKRFAPAGLFLLIAAASAWYGNTYHELVQNPDPNHTHADFAVWIGEKRLDFSDPEYMSTPPAQTSFLRSLTGVSAALAHGEEGGEVLPGRGDLHLHDGNGHVIHMHKPGQTIGDFFQSIGLKMTETCLTLDKHQMQKFEAQRKQEMMPGYTGFILFHEGDRDVCTGALFQWEMFVNGNEHPFDPSYRIQDLDHILLSYNDGDVQQKAIKQQLSAMTDDACMYSKTCPWRGEPPTENCIADPEIPCKLQ